MTIDVRNLTKSYQTGEFDLQILKCISFRVDDGEFELAARTDVIPFPATV
ncbi:MAG: hypothetical protein ACR2JW_11015 [Thermomicrobiales bacterium]